MQPGTSGVGRFDRPDLSAVPPERLMDCVIRPALDQDADAVSAVILRALRETNVADYTDAMIERISRSFGPHEVLQIIGKRKVFVATIEGRIVGTAGPAGGGGGPGFVRPAG